MYTTMRWCLRVDTRDVSVALRGNRRGLGNALFKGEFAEIDGIFRSSDEIDELTQLSLEGGLWKSKGPMISFESRQGRTASQTYFVEKFNQVNVVLFLTEVFLEEVVDGSFEHE